MVSITEEQASGAPGCENWHRDFLRCLSRKRYSNMVRVATEAASGDASSKFAAPKSGFFMSIWCRFLGGNTWITCCSGRRQTSKTSCSISGPTSTTIARITHWQGKRRIRPRHDHQPISTRFDGNHTVEPLSDPGGCLICQRLALAVVLVHLGNTSKEIIWCSQLQRVSQDLIVHTNRIRRDRRYDRLP